MTRSTNIGQTSIKLGGADPRIRRNAQETQDVLWRLPLESGPGGKVRIRPMKGLALIPEGASAETIRVAHNKLLAIMRESGFLE